MNQVTALISQPDGSFTIQQIEPELTAMQKIVGGYLEAITAPDWMLYFDEEGKFKDNRVNRSSTIMLDQLAPGFAARDVLVGSVIWLGGASGDGKEKNLTGELAEVFTAIATGDCNPDQPLCVVRYGSEVWVFDTIVVPAVTDLVARLFAQAQDRLSEGNGFGTIEVVPAITRGRWTEIRVDIMDDPRITLHDERDDRSYG